MKAIEIIKTLKSVDDEHATRLLEDIFMSGFMNGVNKGYDNMYRLIRKDGLSSDVEEAKRIFVRKYL